MPKGWTTKEEKIVADLYRDTTATDLCNKIARSKDAIYIHVSRMQKSGRLPKKNKSWTVSERKYLVDNYYVVGALAISIRMGISVEAVMRQAYLMRKSGEMGLQDYRQRRR